jgi:hypothetical protein
MYMRFISHPRNMENMAADEGKTPAPEREEDVPADEALEAFKGDVRTWLGLDASIRELQAQVRERRAAKRAMTARIGAFMSRYNVEDLRTAEGTRLRYRVSLVRSPLSHGDIRERLARHFREIRIADDETVVAEELRAMNDAIFVREKVAKPFLRKLPIPRISLQ